MTEYTHIYRCLYCNSDGDGGWSFQKTSRWLNAPLPSEAEQHVRLVHAEHQRKHGFESRTYFLPYFSRGGP